MPARYGNYRYIRKFSQGIDEDDADRLEENIEKYPRQGEVVENMIKKQSGYVFGILRLPKRRSLPQ
jgi:hypothetical protein